MANDDHIAQLKNGVDAWNAWRHLRNIPRPADLSSTNLIRANLGEADLSESHLDRFRTEAARPGGW